MDEPSSCRPKLKPPLKKQSIEEIIERRQMLSQLLVSVPDYIEKVHCDITEADKPFKCAVSTCENCYEHYQTRLPYKFHNFPANNKKLQKTWLQLCGLPEDFDLTSTKVCSEHFTLDDYIRNYREEFSNPDFKRQLSKNAVPSLKLPTTNINIKTKAPVFERKRMKRIKSEPINCSQEQVIQAVDEKEDLEQEIQEKEAQVEDLLSQLETMECIVRNCPSKDPLKDGLETLHVPQDAKQQAEWLKAIKHTKTIDLKSTTICSLHFEDYFFVKIEDSACRQLCPDAFPTKFLPDPTKYELITTQDHLNDVLRLNQTLKHKSSELDKKLNLLSSQIQDKQEDLQKLCSETNRKQEESEKKLLEKIFSQAQIRFLCKGHTVNWSHSDLAQAFIIDRLGSYQVYDHLRNKLKFPLPARSTLNSWISIEKTRKKHKN